MGKSNEELSDKRFSYFDGSINKETPKGWYYRTREGTFGPFHSREDAANHLSLRIQTTCSDEPGFLKRWANTFISHPSERRIKESPLKGPNNPPDGANQRDSSPPPPHTADPRETSTFDRPSDLDQPPPSDQHQRLPHNKTKTLRLTQGYESDIYLASYRFVLSISGINLHMTDVNRKTHILYQGTSTIGRNTNNDIVTDRNLTEISRYHLIIDWNGVDGIRLTDISSLGTYVLAENLKD